MEQEKIKQIEARLREMLVAENRPRKESRQITNKPGGVRVIRRRKGAPDKQIM